MCVDNTGWGEGDMWGGNDIDVASLSWDYVWWQSVKIVQR